MNRSKREVFPYSTAFALFRKLVDETDGLTGRIDIDTTAENGDADLQVCAYISTNGLYSKKGVPEHTTISFVLCRDPGVYSYYIPETEIFKRIC